MVAPIEVPNFHPVVAKWLTENGYTYIHEYELPDWGRVDFYATHSDGHTMLVECKIDGALLGAIKQIVSYGVQMPECKLVIAHPSVFIKVPLRNMAAKYNVQLLEIPYRLSDGAILPPLPPLPAKAIKGYQIYISLKQEDITRLLRLGAWLELNGYHVRAVTGDDLAISAVVKAITDIEIEHFGLTELMAIKNSSDLKLIGTIPPMRFTPEEKAALQAAAASAGMSMSDFVMMQTNLYVAQMAYNNGISVTQFLEAYKKE